MTELERDALWSFVRKTEPQTLDLAYIAAAPGSIRQKDGVFREVRSDAEELSAFVHSSLQSLTASHLTFPLPTFFCRGHRNLQTAPCVLLTVKSTAFPPVPQMTLKT